MTRAAMIRYALVAGLAVLVAPTGAAALNYKKEYFSNKAYVGNSANKYPHLYCGKGFFTVATSRNHDKLESRGNCNKANELLADPP